MSSHITRGHAKLLFERSLEMRQGIESTFHTDFCNWQFRGTNEFFRKFKPHVLEIFLKRDAHFFAETFTEITLRHMHFPGYVSKGNLFSEIVLQINQ